MCEKPLTTDVSTSLEIVRREAELDRPLIQVGFMRRFDDEYMRLKALLDGGELGQPLVMHCVHRNPGVPSYFDSSLIVKDSLVHEVDVTRFLFDEEIAGVQIVRPASNPAAPEGVTDPQIAILRTASGKHVDVELFVTTGVAYEVRTEVVGEKGSAMIGLDVGLIRKSAPGTWVDRSPQDFVSASAAPTTPRSNGGWTPYGTAPSSTARPRGTGMRPPQYAPQASNHSKVVCPSKFSSQNVP